MNLSVNRSHQSITDMFIAIKAKLSRSDVKIEMVDGDLVVLNQDDSELSAPDQALLNSIQLNKHNQGN